MSNEEVFDDSIIDKLCEDAIKAAFKETAEMAAEDKFRRNHSEVCPFEVAKKNAPDGWTSVHIRCPFLDSRTKVMTKADWTRYLPLCSDRGSCDRDISLTHKWINCSPHQENENLRQRHAQRVTQWRELCYGRYSNTCDYENNLHVLTKYKYPGSLVDLACPVRRPMETKSSGDGDAISLSDILLEFVDEAEVTEVTEMMGVKVTDTEEVKVTDIKGVNDKKRKRRFLGCFGR